MSSTNEIIKALTEKPGVLILHQLIEFLETRDPDKVCQTGFNNPHSYRGDYYELAFEPVVATFGEMLASARSAVGATYEGYKGGDFTMSEGNFVHLAHHGESGEEISSAHIRLWSQPEEFQPWLPT